MLKKSIFSKVFILIILTSLTMGSIILVVTLRQRTQDLKEVLTQENKLLAETVANVIETTYLEQILPFKTLKKIAEGEDISFLWIVKSNGEIYYADDPEMFGKIIDDPSLGTKEVVIKDSISPKDGEKIQLIVSPLKIEVGGKPWNLFLGVSLKRVTTAKEKVIFSTLGLFVAIIILTAFLSFYLAKGITGPLEHLRKGAEIIGKGNLDHRIKLKTGDEIEELAEDFNKMTERLSRSRTALEESKEVLEIKVKARTKELQELAQSLEDKVKERTKELRSRVEELERFHRLTVGRELKMLELKKEIEELKGREKNHET